MQLLLGEFVRTQDGYQGRIETLGIDAELYLVPIEPREAENAPDYRIHLNEDDGPEVGAAWKETGKKAGAYLSIQLDSPIFVQPIRANLFRTDETGAVNHLLWSRPQPRKEQD